MQLTANSREATAFLPITNHGMTAVSIAQPKRPYVEHDDLRRFPVKLGIRDSFRLQLLRIQRDVAHRCSIASVPFDDPEIACLFIQCRARDHAIGFRGGVILETPDSVTAEVESNGRTIGADVVA